MPQPPTDRQRATAARHNHWWTDRGVDPPPARPPPLPGMIGAMYLLRTRLTLGLKQDEMAAILDLSRAMLHNWEHGQPKITRDQLKARLERYATKGTTNGR